MNELMSTQLINSIGISIQTFWWIFFACSSLALSLIGVFVFYSITLAILIMPIPLVFGIVFGYIPVWVGVMLPLPIIYMIIFGQGGQVEPENIKPYWEQYGDNLKNAYSSKFGGENPAFNQEVDNHVKIMINNGRGFTRALANDWMKRMGKFTECK